MGLKVPETLESERLVIRPFVLDDLEGLYFFMSDEEVTKHLLFSEDEKTFDASRHLLLRTISSDDNQDQIYALAVAIKHEYSFIGSVGIGPDFSGENYQVHGQFCRNFLGKVLQLRL